MADVGLDAELALDTRAALQRISQIERQLGEATNLVLRADASAITAAIDAALAQARSEVDVTGDASQVTGAVDAAVDAADDTVEITGDASQVTGEIDAAVDEADSNVVVTGDASQVTGAITAAVDQADTSVTIDADATSLREAGDAADDLNAALIASSASGIRLRTILQLGGAGAATAGLFQLVDAASELEQAIGGTEAIFGRAAGTIETFARGADEAAGLTEEAARTLTSRIGGLLRGFDFTQQEAAETSVALAQLGADLAAAFGGRPEEAVEALGAALRGEFDPLERFGVSLNITQANLKAVELGLAESTSQVSLNARAQAALAIIMERSADVQGQFAREANTTAGQMERLRAEAGNAAAEIGAGLQPAFNDLLATARQDLLPALLELGTGTLPPLAEAFADVIPAATGLLDILIAASPVITTIANLIGSLPPELITFATAMGLASRIAGPLQNTIAGLSTQFTAAQASGQGLGRTLAGNARNFLSANAGALTLSAGIGIVTIGLAENARQAAEHRAAMREIRDAMLEAETAAEGLAEALQSPALDQTETLTALGLTAREFADIVLQATNAEEALLEIMRRSRQETGRRISAFGVEGVILRGIIEDTRDQAQAAFEAAAASGDYSDELVRGAVEAATAADGTVNYAEALDRLRRNQEVVDAGQQVVNAAIEQMREEAELARQVTELLGGSLQRAADGVGDASDDFVAFARAAANAELSEEGMALAAETLGVSVTQLEAQIEAVTAVIDDFVSSVAQSMPSIVGEIGELDEITFEGLEQSFQDAFNAVVDFQENLATLAAFPAVQQAAAAAGPEVAAALAQGFRDGQIDALERMELLAIGTAQTQDNILDQSTVWGADLASTMLDAGVGATDGFAFGFQPEAAVIGATGAAIDAVNAQVEPLATAASNAGLLASASFDGAFAPELAVQTALDASLAVVTGFSPQLFAAAEGVGSGATSGMQTGLAGMPGVADDAATGAQGSIGATELDFDRTAARVGDRATAGFASGLRGMSGAAGAAMTRATAQLEVSGATAASVAFGVGQDISAGLAAGIRSAAGRVADSATQTVFAALSAARRAAQTGSPSRLFARLGDDMAAGIALGLERSVGQVEDASAAAVRAALAAAQAAGTGVDIPATAALGAAPAGGTVVQVAEGAVQVNLPPGTTPAQAERLGAAASQGFLSKLATRQIYVTARAR